MGSAHSIARQDLFTPYLSQDISCNINPNHGISYSVLLQCQKIDQQNGSRGHKYQHPFMVCSGQDQYYNIKHLGDEKNHLLPVTK